MTTSWIITTRHLDARGPDGRQPVGERHARAGDSGRTACGLFALGWPTFWYLPFDPLDPDSCSACGQVIERAKRGITSGNR